MKHQHFNPQRNEFVEHEHIHSGPHQHKYDPTVGRVVLARGPGNYAPTRRGER